MTIALGPIILTFTLSGNPATNSVSFAPLTFNGISITIDFSFVLVVNVCPVDCPDVNWSALT